MLLIIKKDKKEYIASISNGSFFLDSSALVNLDYYVEKTVEHSWPH